MEARRLPAVLVAAAVLALAAASPAVAGPRYYKSRAWFKATVEGTYTAHGAEEEQCSRQVGEDQFESFTVTKTVDETLAFKSTRSVRFEADRYLDNSVGAGTLNRRTPVAATTTRTLVESAPCDPQRPAPVCGTKTPHFGLSLISRSGPLRLFYNFNDGAVIFPDDPFDFACRVPSVPWWGKLSSGAAPLPAGKLFDKRRRSFTIRAHSAKPTSQGNYTLDFAVKLVRTHR